MNCPEQFWQLVEGRARLWWMMTTGLVQKERWCVLLLMQEVTYTPNVGQFWWCCADTHTHERRCLMGVLKCCSKWCRNFSCLQNSFRNVWYMYFIFFFRKWKEKKIIIVVPSACVIWTVLVLFTLVGWRESSKPKTVRFHCFLASLSRQFYFMNVNRSAGKLKIN